MAITTTEVNPFTNERCIRFAMSEYELFGSREFTSEIIREAIKAISERLADEYYEEIRAALLAQNGLDELVEAIKKEWIAKTFSNFFAKPNV